jgi:hypothetical protein
MAMIFKNVVFWGIISCSFVVRYQRYGGICSLHPQDSGSTISTFLMRRKLNPWKSLLCLSTQLPTLTTNQCALCKGLRCTFSLLAEPQSILCPFFLSLRTTVRVASLYIQTYFWTQTLRQPSIWPLTSLYRLRKMRNNLLYKAWADRDLVYIVYTEITPTCFIYTRKIVNIVNTRM